MIIQEKQHLIWKEKDIRACLNKDKEKELEKHRQFHVIKSKHQCNRCSYSASLPQHLSAHMRNHNPNLEQVLICLIFLIKIYYAIMISQVVSETPSGADDIPQGKRVKLQVLSSIFIAKIIFFIE